jgi:small subunit ribosomal protein S20
MANRRQSIKKIRVDKRRREHNLLVRTELKTVAREVRSLLAGKKTAELKEASRKLFSKLDKAVKKHVIHANRASRVKSRIQKKITALVSTSSK